MIFCGDIQVESRFFLAPMAGVTDLAFRSVCAEMGAALTYTEMVSAKALTYNDAKSRGMLVLREGDVVCIPQIFGSDPEVMAEGARIALEVSKAPAIDINMGCPVPKIFGNGDGSALLQDFAKASALIKACKDSGKRVSVKFRIGLTADKLVAADFAKMCEDSGADMISVHGRTRDKIYAGEVNTEQIAAAKNAVKIPVIANGGIFTPADADQLIERTGADGVMLARGAMYSPWLFAGITSRPMPDKRALVKKQLEDTFKVYGERFAIVFMRKMAAFYTKGKPGSSALREKLFTCDSMQSLEKMIDGIEF